MQEKKCNKCGLQKTIDLFDKVSDCKYGVSGCCKECRRKKAKFYRKNNPEKIKIQKTRHSKKYSKKITEKTRIWRLKNPEKYKIQNRLNVLKRKNTKRTEEQKEKRRIHVRKRRNADPMFKLRHDLRIRMGKIFIEKCIKKDLHSLKLLGATFELVKNHLEKQFKSGMNWQNRGQGDNKWHIDHMIPLSSAKTEEELIELCHYTNLQPLWAKDNVAKKDKILYKKDNKYGIPVELIIGQYDGVHPDSECELLPYNEEECIKEIKKKFPKK